jgi:glycosyltransferase involved in cell wall biosynthesis
MNDFKNSVSINLTDEKQKKSNKKILFISHDATRTGAPILLLNLLSWFKENSNISFQVLFRNDGPLVSEFEKMAGVTVLKWYFKDFNFFQKVLRRIGFKEFYQKKKEDKLIKTLSYEKFDIIYANTITNGETLELLSKLNATVLCHVHELEFRIRCLTGLENFGKTKDKTHYYIAVSEAVKRNLVENHGIEPDKIGLVHGFTNEFENAGEKSLNRKSEIRQELRIRSSDLVVGASGTTDWRKGPDLFIQLAYAVHRKIPGHSVHFVWMGGQNNGIEFEKLWYDVGKLGLEQTIHFIGHQKNPMDYFSIFDVFALVSREDPFPLVCLEAASVGIPILCFDKAGGIGEFVENDCGFVVPYLDIEAMAEKLILLLTSEKLRKQFGHRAASKVGERNGINVAAPKILRILEQFNNK